MKYDHEKFWHSLTHYATKNCPENTSNDFDDGRNKPKLPEQLERSEKSKAIAAARAILAARGKTKSNEAPQSSKTPQKHGNFIKYLYISLNIYL